MAGELTSGELLEVEPGVFLYRPTGYAYLNMKADANAAMSIARPDGAYRTRPTTQDLYNQWAGLPHQSDHNLDPGSGARPANPAQGQVSVHEWGRCADIWGAAFDNGWVRANMGRYGFSHPLSNDPHHFQHDGVTATNARNAWNPDDIKRVAAFLNAANLGKTTNAAADGNPYNGTPAVFSNFMWLVQAWGAHNGLYDTGAYRVDGIEGPRTDVVLQQLIQRTASVVPSISWNTDDVRRVAAYLNGLNLGKTSSAAVDGSPYNGAPTNSSNFFWLVQAWGAQQGAYPQPPYVIDGIEGPKTDELVVTLIMQTGGHSAPPLPAVPESPYAVGAVGIDVSGYQRGIDWAQVVEQGVQFAAVKQGGLNVAPQYVSSDYAELVDNARAAGVIVGHYFVTGQGDPAAAAERFVATLHNFIVEHDFIMLDNEKLDANGAFWSPTNAATWLAKVIELTGINPARVYHYASASGYKSGVDWAPVTAVIATNYWYAAYGTKPYSTNLMPTQASIPEPNGSIPDWAIHQHSSNAQIGGKTVDANASRKTLAELFPAGGNAANKPPVVDAPPPTANPEEPPVSDPTTPTTPGKPPAPVVDPDVDGETLNDAALATLNGFLPFISAPVRGTIYAIGTIGATVLPPYAVLLGGRVGLIIGMVSGVCAAIVGSTALNNLSSKKKSQAQTRALAVAIRK